MKKMRGKRGLSLLMAVAVSLGMVNFPLVAVSAAEYSEMLNVATEQKVADNGDIITYTVPAGKQTVGRDLKFTADWTRPKSATGLSFQLKLSIKEGDAEAQTKSIVEYNNTAIKYFAADGTSTDTGIKFSDLGTSTTFAAESWGNVILELDMANGKFKLTIGGNNTTSSTEYLLLPFTVTDWSDAVLTEIAIEKVNAKNTYQSVKNAVLSYVLSKSDEVEALIAALPQGEELAGISYDDVEALNAKLAAIDVYFNEGVSAGNKAIYDAVVEKLQNLEKDKQGKFTYLVSKLPAEITTSNYQDYDEILAELAEILAEKPELETEIPTEVAKYKNTEKQIEIIGGVIELDGLLDDIAKYKNNVTKQNIANINAIAAEIEPLLQNPDITYNSSKKTVYDNIMAAVAALMGEYDRYIKMDISNSYNAKLYAEQAEATLDNPEFYAPNFSGANINYKPDWVMHKPVIENALDASGVIYSNKEIPIYVDTTGGVIIGSAGDNTITEITIPVQKGYYESVSVATRSSFAQKNTFGYTVNYADGSTVSLDCDYAPMWKGAASGFGVTMSSNQIDIAYDLSYIKDWIKFSKVSSNNSYPLLNNSDSSTPEYEQQTSYSDLLVPVLTLTTDPTKIVESVTISSLQKISTDVLGITATLPSESVAKASIEAAIQDLKGSEVTAANSKTELEAIATVMDRYMAADGTDKNIADIDVYNTLKATYDANVVTVLEKLATTGWRNAVASFNFLNPINEAGIESYISVTKNGAEFNDYTVEVTNSGKNIEILIDNNLDYTREFIVTVNGALTSGGSDKTFTLGQSNRLTLKPTAPIAIASFDLKNENGTALESLSSKNHGDKVKVFVDLLNSSISPKQGYSMSIGLYDAKGKLIEGYVRNGELDEGMNKGETFEFTLDLTNGANEIRCFVMESYETMREFDYAEVN